MKSSIPGSALLLCVLGTAHAQTTAIPQQRAASPIQRTQATSAPAVSRPAAAVLQTQPYAAVGKATLPGNLLSVEDRAIIIVGGKPVAAGAIKQQLRAELRQASIPGSARFSRTPPQGVPVRDLPGRFGASATDRVDAVRQPSRVAGSLSGRDAITARPALSYTEMLNYCKTHAPEISRVRGTVTPNGRFKIEGMCFGDQTGSIEAIGQFPGGTMRLVFESWADSEIAAFVPPVSGAQDHAIAVTVVRTDRARSPAAQARFVATRQQMPVPPNFWNHDPNFVAIEVDQGGGDIFSGFRIFGAESPQRSTPFSLRINPACELDSAAWSSRTGRVDAFNGWDNPGPPNTANVDVVWTPRCVTQTTNYVFSKSSQRICSVEFSLAAWANCPVGLAP
jgi:hypothetical protein